MSKLIIISSTGNVMFQEKRQKEEKRFSCHHPLRFYEAWRGGCSNHSNLWILSQSHSFDLAQYTTIGNWSGWIVFCQPCRQPEGPGLPIHPSPRSGTHHRCCFNHINRFPNSALYQIQVRNYRFKISPPIIPPSI